ncbi:TAP-like protein-domain-containing protein [Mycena rebaudengoi]|nr:TAP-like protein-domain-containing protein [Mycena rebaudengoi]
MSSLPKKVRIPLAVAFAIATLYVLHDSDSTSAMLSSLHVQDGLSSQNFAQSDKFLWETIEPTEELVWTRCYEDHHCARLKVPLDYSNPHSESAAIAMVRFHSVVPHNSSSYRGPILINPGGPGGSGVDFGLNSGKQLSTIVGPEFDIIGFDPRGIGRSIPRVSFFETRAEREIYTANSAMSRSLNSSNDALSRAYAQALIVGQLASERDAGSLRYINTENTVHDMLRIVQAHGREKLQFWGFSYGTILGATFAAMFPNNVERIVIDGVADSTDYYEQEWANSLVDTDKVWQSFYDGCVAAGPDGCPFYAPTAEDINTKMDRIYASLRTRPIPVRTNMSYGLVDYAFVRSVIFSSLYKPYARFAPLARALADLAEGNATAMFKMAEKPSFECGCDPSEYRFEVLLMEAGVRIPSTFEAAQRHYVEMGKISTWADIGALTRMACTAWPDFPKDHFKGPFVANTSFPLLLVGNTADPVTPLNDAKRMSKGFAGSVVLTQDSAGVPLLVSAPSVCTQKHVRQYFLKGALPEPGTVCPVNGTPFDVNDFKDDSDVQTVLGLSVDDRNLLEILQHVANTINFRFL